MTTREEMKEILHDKYPEMWINFGESFDEHHQGSLWTGEGSTTQYSFDDEEGNVLDEMELFDYSENDGFLYQGGIWKELVELLSEHGWYAEFYDGGTVFLYPQ